MNLSACEIVLEHVITSHLSIQTIVCKIFVNIYIYSHETMGNAQICETTDGSHWNKKIWYGFARLEKLTNLTMLCNWLCTDTTKETNHKVRTFTLSKCVKSCNCHQQDTAEKRTTTHQFLKVQQYQQFTNTLSSQNFYSRKISWPLAPIHENFWHFITVRWIHTNELTKQRQI